MSTPLFHMFDSAPRAVAPYSHAVEADGWVFITGQIPEEPGNESDPLPEGIEAQTRRVMDNLVIVLGNLGLELENVVTARAFITEFERDYQAMNKVYRSYFAEGQLPARTCVGVTAMARGALVEIDFIARRSEWPGTLPVL